jgi:hypothetical protein
MFTKRSNSQSDIRLLQIPSVENNENYFSKKGLKIILAILRLTKSRARAPPTGGVFVYGNML